MSNFNYFANCKNLDEVKEVYRKLAKKYHPDINPSGESEMKKINAAYDEAIKNLKDTTNNTKANSQVDEAKVFKNIINELIKYDNIGVEVCGWWLWITCPKELKHILEGLQVKFYWSRKKCKWYYRPTWYKSNNRKEWNMDKIREKYGSEKMQKNKKASKKLEAIK